MRGYEKTRPGARAPGRVKWAGRDLNAPNNPRRNVGDAPEGGAESGALSGDSTPPTVPATPADPELAEVVNAWSALPAAVRAGIVAMVRSVDPRADRG